MELLPIPGEWIINGGAVGLLGWVALMIFRGGLVPRRTFDELKEERDTWRLIALKAMGQTEALLPAAQISTKVAQTLAENTRVGGPQ
jgi:hypothetical protein